MKTKYALFISLAAAFAATGRAQGIQSGIPDLVIGFESSGNPTDYEADLGSMANYVSLPEGTLIDLSGNISGNDLASTFGSNWNGTIAWGAAATVGPTPTFLNGIAEPAKTNWLATFDSISPNLIPSLPGSPAPFRNGFPIMSNTRMGRIERLYTGLSGPTAMPSPMDPNTAVTIPASDPNSWSAFVHGSNGFQPGFDLNTQVSFGPGQYEVLDLFQYSATSPSVPPAYVGSLELGADGSLWFATASEVSIPEPSAYAAIFGAATLGFAALRRRQQRQIVI